MQKLNEIFQKIYESTKTESSEIDEPDFMKNTELNSKTILININRLLKAIEDPEIFEIITGVNSFNIRANGNNQNYEFLNFLRLVEQFKATLYDITSNIQAIYEIESGEEMVEIKEKVKEKLLKLLGESQGGSITVMCTRLNYLTFDDPVFSELRNQLDVEQVERINEKVKNYTEYGLDPIYVTLLIALLKTSVVEKERKLPPFGDGNGLK